MVLEVKISWNVWYGSTIQVFHIRYREDPWGLRVLCSRRWQC